jgi:hypothetical protein
MGSIFMTTAVEYCKTVYDYYKHLMTVSLAAIAPFGAMLGGVFSNSAAWPDGALVSRTTFVVLVFACFLQTALAAAQAMAKAERNILRIGELETAEELTEFAASGEPIFDNLRIVIIIPFGLGVIGLMLFVLMSLS